MMCFRNELAAEVLVTPHVPADPQRAAEARRSVESHVCAVVQETHDVLFCRGSCDTLVGTGPPWALAAVKVVPEGCFAVTSLQGWRKGMFSKPCISYKLRVRTIQFQIIVAPLRFAFQPRVPAL